jgi:hypothetical protein
MRVCGAAPADLLVLARVVFEQVNLEVQEEDLLHPVDFPGVVDRCALLTERRDRPRKVTLSPSADTAMVAGSGIWGSVARRNPYLILESRVHAGLLRVSPLS